MKTNGLWVSERDFVHFAEPRMKLGEQLATRAGTLNFSALGMYLPNPDPVLKALGRDIETYRDLRADAHVGGCIRRRKSAVKSLEWGLDRGAAPARLAKSLEALLADLPLDRIIGEALDAVLYGYQPLEIVWGKVGSWVVPVDVIGKPPEWFVFGNDNELRLRTREEPRRGVVLPDRKFLLPRQDASYSNPYGFADLSMVFWPTTFKKGGLKFWVQFTEKYGAPWLIGKHPRSASTEETTTLLDSLEAMVQDAVAVIPDDASVEIKEAGGKAASADIYEKLLTFCRGEVSIALLGQNQTTESDSTRASATAGLEVTRDIRDGDAKLVAETINTLIRWICDLNVADGTARPVFSLWAQEAVDKVQAERDEKLRAAGAVFTPAYFRRAYNLQDGDLAEPAPETPTAAIAFAEGQGDPDYAEAVTSVLAQAAQPVLDDWLARIRRRIDNATDLPQLQDDLLAEFSELDEAELAQAMGLAFSCAEVAGRAEVGRA